MSSSFQMNLDSILKHHGGHIRIWQHGAHTWPTRIPLWCTGRQSIGVMVWGAMWYPSPSIVTSCLHLQHFEQWPLYFCCVIACDYILYSSPAKRLFQQDSARPHVAVQTFLGKENVRLLPKPAWSRYLSQIENVRSFGAEMLIYLAASSN